MALNYDINYAGDKSTTVSPLPEPKRPNVLFRVICKEGYRWGPGSPNQGFDQNGDLWPRLPPTADCYLEDIDNHLAWKAVPTPFISFFSDWDTTVRRTQWMVRNGGKDVSIIAIWSKDLDKLYDAHCIAKSLSYKDREYIAYPSQSQYWRRRILQHHQHEYLYHGPLMARDSRLLAIFNSEHEYECICKLSVDMWMGSFDCAAFRDHAWMMQRLFDQYRSQGPAINIGKLWALVTVREQPRWEIYQHSNGDIYVNGKGKQWKFRDVPSEKYIWGFHQADGLNENQWTDDVRKSKNEGAVERIVDRLLPSTRYSASGGDATGSCASSALDGMYHHVRTLFYHGGVEIVPECIKPDSPIYLYAGGGTIVGWEYTR